MTLVPRQAAAYPSIDIVKALKALREGKLLCTLVDQAGRQLGEIFIKEKTGESMVVECHFAGPYVMPFSGEVRFRLVASPNGVDAGRAYILCTGCGGRSGIVYFVNGWACRKCHKLHRRSQLVCQEARLWERRDALLKRVGGGRPARMHNSTYGKLRSELDRLEKRLPRVRRSYASDLHDLAIRSIWIAPADHEPYELFHPRFRIRGGKLEPVPASVFDPAPRAEQAGELSLSARPTITTMVPPHVDHGPCDGTEEDWLGDGPVYRS